MRLLNICQLWGEASGELFRNCNKDFRLLNTHFFLHKLERNIVLNIHDDWMWTVGSNLRCRLCHILASNELSMWKSLNLCYFQSWSRFNLSMNIYKIRLIKCWSFSLIILFCKWKYFNWKFIAPSSFNVSLINEPPRSLPTLRPF